MFELWNGGSRIQAAEVRNNHEKYMVGLLSIDVGDSIRASWAGDLRRDNQGDHQGRSNGLPLRQSALRRGIRREGRQGPGSAMAGRTRQSRPFYEKRMERGVARSRIR